MITSYQLFCEAIKLSQAKDYTELWYKKGGNNIHAEFFSKLNKGKPDTKYRLYYPFNVEDNPENKVVDSLETDITKLLTDNGYVDADYIGNKVQDKYKRIVKISSVLAKLKQPELLNQYNANLDRSNSKSSSDEYMIVISRHPVDLAGMSTNRGWTSCMDLKDGGSNKKYIKQDVIYGTLVAYIIKSTDLNIQNPIGRCLIKPFINSNDNIVKIYLPEMKTYGTLSKTTQQNFLTFINSWCEDNLNKDKIDGQYHKNTILYADDGFDRINKISLRKYFEDNYKVENNTVVINSDILIHNTNINSLNADGLKVILYGKLDLRNNPALTSLAGIENWDIKGNIVADWKNFKDITLRQIILYSYKPFIKWIDDNTIEINNYLELQDCGLKSLDTDGLKVIIERDLYLYNNPELTSLAGLENFDVKGDIYADWYNIKGITIKDIIVYRHNNKFTWKNNNTIEINDTLDLQNCGLKSLDTDGLKVIVKRNLDLRRNPELTSLDGLENFKIKRNIDADWVNFTDVSLRDILLYQYKSDIKWIDKNTIEIKYDVNLFKFGLKSLDTEGLKVIVKGSLYLGNNLDLKSVAGLENFEVVGRIL